MSQAFQNQSKKIREELSSKKVLLWALFLASTITDRPRVCLDPESPFGFNQRSLPLNHNPFSSLKPNRSKQQATIFGISTCATPRTHVDNHQDFAENGMPDNAFGIYRTVGYRMPSCTASTASQQVGQKGWRLSSGA